MSTSTQLPIALAELSQLDRNGGAQSQLCNSFERGEICIARYRRLFERLDALAEMIERSQDIFTVQPLADSEFLLESRSSDKAGGEPRSD
jgi:hypothetical protein